MTIDCTKLAELLFDFVNGDLPDDRRELLEAHIQSCTPCYLHVETYRITITLTRKLPCKELPADVEQRLRDAVAREWCK